LAGGLAGSFLGSLLFRGGSGYGYGYGAAPGSGLIGLVELLFLLGAGYLALRWWRQRQPLAEGGPIGAAPGPIYRAPAEEDTGEDPLETLARYDAGFDPEAFKEARTDDFFKIQAAFMARDLSGVRSLLAPEIVSGIESDIAALKAAGRINRLENITVRQIDIAEAWQEEGKEYATLHLRANLLDYTVDEKSGEVIQGSRAEPVKFEEYWTFVRGLGYASDFRNWRLSAIEQQT
jgi:predicted lipid-binding transport protein (Tim44 family)